MNDNTVVEPTLDSVDDGNSNTFDEFSHAPRSSVPTDVYTRVRDDMQEYKKQKRVLAKSVETLTAEIVTLKTQLTEKDTNFEKLETYTKDVAAMNQYNKEVTDLFSKNKINADPTWLSPFLSEDKPIEQSIKEFTEKYPHVRFASKESRSGTMLGDPTPNRSNETEVSFDNLSVSEQQSIVNSLIDKQFNK